MTNSSIEIKLYYIELLKEHLPEKHAELIKTMEATRAETIAKEIPPKQPATAK